MMNQLQHTLLHLAEKGAPAEAEQETPLSRQETALLQQRQVQENMQKCFSHLLHEANRILKEGGVILMNSSSAEQLPALWYFPLLPRPVQQQVVSEMLSHQFIENSAKYLDLKFQCVPDTSLLYCP